MKKTDMYEGVCKYCGSIESVFADSQEEADAEISKKCKCGGAAEEERMERIVVNAKSVTEEEPQLTDILIIGAGLILKGVLDALTLKTEGVRHKVSINGDGQIKFVRTETKSQSASE